jgi:anti-sigma regulatory factor (Ser/Thr protein kinase)
VVEVRAAMDVPSDLADLGPARGAIVEQVLSWGAPIDPAILALLVSEVVANAVEHGSPPIAVSVDWDGARLRVEVHDCAPAMPVRRQPDHDDDGGRGIWLVDRNASAWGVEQADGGKSVWFELRRSGPAQDVVGGRPDLRST